MNRATFSLQLSPHAQDGWHLLLPAGEVKCRDGRGPFVNDALAILKAFADWGMPVDVDYHHQSLSAEGKNGLVPSAGSVVELDNRDGEIWGRFEWTEAATEAIAAKEAKFVSPVFDYDKTNRITQLVSVGLTNLPNLYLTPLSANSLGGKAMDDLIQQLCYMLNLPVTSTPEEIKTHLQRLMDSLGNADDTGAAMGQLGKSLRLDGAKWPAIAQAANALLIPGKMVPVEEFDRVSHELQTLKNAALEAEVQREIAIAKTAGKLSPSMEAWGANYARNDLQGFKQWAANALPVIASGEIIVGQQGNRAVIPPDAPNPERWQLLAEAKAYQAKHSCSFTQAVKVLESA